MYILYYIYISLFHPRYLHNDIFRHMTNSLYFMLLFQAVLHKIIILVVIATGPNFNIFWFLQLPSSGVPSLTGLEQLLKCQAGVWVAPTTNFSCELTFL